MDLFSISQLQQFSGIKAHTIRMWEQRYNALSPNRSEGNTRYYDGTQLRRLLNIVSLKNLDYKVSDLCSMSDKELFHLLQQDLAKSVLNDDANEYYVSQLIAAGMSFDETGFDKIFSTCILRMGIRDTYINVLYPMLERVGLMWANDTLAPAYEHFISNLITQKIYSAIDGLPPAKSAKNTWLLFLPENEFHEIGLLFSNYLLRHSSRKVIYLGANVPFDTLKQTVKQVNPSHLLFFLVHHHDPEDVKSYLTTLKKSFSQSIHFAANKSTKEYIHDSKGIHWIHSVQDLESQIQ